MADSLNICMFSRVNYWQGIKGGMELHGKLLSEGIVKRGHKVTMICTRHPKGIEHEKRNGVDICYLKNSVFSSRRQGWMRSSVLNFSELHRNKPFDLIWSQSFDAFVFAHMKKMTPHIPIVLTLHGSIEQEFRTFRVNFLNDIKGKIRLDSILKKIGGLFFSYFITQAPLLRCADRIITVSPKVADDLGKWFGRKVVSKCTTILNGLDVEHFKPDFDHRRYIRRKYNMEDHETLVLSVGRLTHEKGHHLAIEALYRLRQRGRNVKLMIVGGGPNLNELMVKAGKLELRGSVIFIGSVKNEDLPAYYNGSDIFVMPTLTVEAFPYVLMEAMACGKPVVVSSIGGSVAEISEGKNGLMFSPGDIDGLIEKVVQLIDDEQKRDALSREGRRKVVEKYSVDRMVLDTLAVMETAVLFGKGRMQEV